MQELDRVVDSQGWIGGAFHLLEEHVDIKFKAVDQSFQEINAKLDIILRHLAGMGNPES